MAAMSVKAGLTFTVDLYVSGGYYVFYTPLATNALGADPSFGNYAIFSPQWPANGSSRQFVLDSSGLNTVAGTQYSSLDLAPTLDQITNGLWTLQFSNATTTNIFRFAVSIPGGFTSNQLPVTYVTSPSNGATNMTNMPTFTWQGQPADWPVTGTIELFQNGKNSTFFYPDPAPVPVTQSNFSMPLPIPADGPNDQTYFQIDYVTNYTGTLFVATTPTNVVGGAPYSGWSYNSTLESGAQIAFTVIPPPASGTNHALVAHYTFDDPGFLGMDFSTNGNDLECESVWGAGEEEASTTDAVAGGGAVQFFGDTSLTPCGGPAFEEWTNALLGSFTVSAWIKTTTVVGGDTDRLNDGDGQTVVYVNNNGNGVLPLGITGRKAAIATGLYPEEYGGDTLNSSNSITTGDYMHVVVTRDAGSGQKQIFINGVLDASDYGVSGILNDGATYASIGGEAGAPYTGELDDVQIYSGVLNSAEVAVLFQSPGSTIPDGVNLTFGQALDTTNLAWTTAGDTSWFLETTNTYNDDPYAAQSGAVTNDQSSTITVTANGPAALTFYWAAQGSEFSAFDYEVYLDGDPYGEDLDDLYSASAFVQEGPFQIPSGPHTISWTTSANGDDDPTEAGFLDQVTISPLNVTMSNPHFSSGYFEFYFNAIPGFNYTVYSTTNLTTGPWLSNGSIYAESAQQLVVEDYSPSQPVQYFTVAPE